MTKRGIPFLSQTELFLEYKGVKLRHTYRPDFICYNGIIVEIKATKENAPEHQAQLMNYLKSTKNRLGLLVNFGHYSKVQIKRMIL